MKRRLSLLTMLLVMLIFMTQGVRAENAKNIYFECNGISFLGVIETRGGWEIITGSNISLIGQINKRWVYRPYVSYASVCAPRSGKYAGEITIPERVHFPGGDIEWEDSIYHLDVNDIGVQGCELEAFENSPGLTKVTFPESVDGNNGGFLFNGSFRGCSSLRTVINMDLRSINDHQFEGCSSLDDINLSKTVRIGNYAFKDCRDLKVKDLRRLSSIGDYAFSGCKSITTIEFQNIFRQAHDTSGDDSNSKGEGVFSGCTSLMDVKGFDRYQPNDGKIGEKFFYHCYSLKEIELSDDIEIIGESAFEDCGILTAISFGKGGTSTKAYKSGLKVEKKAFYNCKNLKVFSGWVKSADEYAFGNCEELGSVVWCSDGGDLKRYSFQGCKILDRITIINQSGSRNHNIEYEAFSGCYDIEDVFLAGVTEVPTCKYGAFPASIEYKYATLYPAYGQEDEYHQEFEDKLNPWHYFTHQNVAYYEGHEWQWEDSGCIFCREDYCHILNGALVGGNFYVPAVDGIDYKAFKDNQRLTSISIPVQISKIEGQVFSNCSNLNGIYVHWATPLLFDKNLPEESQPFAGVDFDKVTLYVPKGCKKLYDVAREWKRFTNIVEMDYTGETWSSPQESNPHTHVHNHRDKTENIISFVDPLTEEICIGKWDANGSGFLSEGEASSVGDLGLDFMGSGITAFCELSYFASLTSIAQNEFADCVHLDSITIPKNVTTIGEKAFSGCNSLKKVFTKIQNPQPFNNNVFTQTAYEQTLLVVPVGTINTYKETAGWKNFYNIVEEGSGQSSGTEPSIGYEPYVVYDNGTLTFYCDGQRSNNEGTTYDLNEGEDEPEWYENRNSITKVVFDPSFAAARPTSGHEWFDGCTQLTEIDGIENLNTSEMTIMDEMFFFCRHLKNVDLSHFNTSKVTDMRAMFSGCSGLKSIDLRNFDTSNTNSLGAMFNGCKNLTEIDLSHFDTSKATHFTNLFSSCTSLKEILFGDSFIISEDATVDNAFENCTNLKTVRFMGDIHSSVNSKFFEGVGTVETPATLIVPKQYKSNFEARFDGKVFCGGYFTLKEAVEGDINGDGEVTDEDKAEVEAFILDPDMSYYPTKDVNHDGFVNVADIVEMVNIMKESSNSGSGYFWLGNTLPTANTFPTLGGKEVAGIVTTYTSLDDAMAKASRTYSANEYAIVFYPSSWGTKEGLVFYDAANMKYYEIKKKELSDFPDYTYYESESKIGADTTITLSTETAAKAAGATLYSMAVAQ